MGTSVFVNELHYNNVLFDKDEGIEIAGPAGTDVNGWKIELYEGASGKVYNTINLSGVIPDQQNGFGTLLFKFSGINNGKGPTGDGLSIVDAEGKVRQFLSYGGVFVATDGQCKDMKSTLIPVEENKTIATKHYESIQLMGVGTYYEDFCWFHKPIQKTFGKVNLNQVFVPPPKTSLVLGPILHFKSTTPEGLYKVSAVVTFKLKEDESVDKIEIDFSSPSGTAVNPVEPPKRHTLLEKDGYTVLRYDMTFQQDKENEQTVWYSISLEGVKRSFLIPGLNQPPRFGYVSCNAVEEGNGIRTDNLWVHMKKNQPHHVLIHGGDQVYSDLPEQFIWLMIPFPKGFMLTNSVLTVVNTSKLPEITDELREQIEKFFFHNYIRVWSQESIREVLASTPSVMMWDDHEIFDGFGSYSDEIQRSKPFQEIFRVARKYFRIFQIGETDEFPSPTTIPNQDVLSQYYYLNQVGILSIDMRSERSKTQIISPKSYDALRGLLKTISRKDIHHMLVLSGVPVCYDNFEMLESAFRAIGNLNLEDDLIDHWDYSTHKQELVIFAKTLLDFATSTKVRVTMLSGDVHVATYGVIVDRDKANQSNPDNSCVIGNLTSSAVGTQPVSATVTRFFEKMSATNRFRLIISKKNPSIVAGLLPFYTDDYHLENRNYLSLNFRKDNSIAAVWHLEQNDGSVKPLERTVRAYTVGPAITGWDPNFGFTLGSLFFNKNY
eukprot:TRINITY_DN5264_c0_g2_i3.p1 TRINITY_DN5264_c0_g2~~TRINITY_DN5264_c0_g2_i3.p1  ORF type:complete len:719 (-),score=126.57 TRINITY_DN5264_c0_g2_i3:19-2175(-)